MSTSDFNKPSLTDKYSDVLQELNDKNNDLARGLASDAVDSGNLPEKSIRWNSGNKFWERLVSGTWAALADVYNIYASRAKTSDECTGNAATASDAKSGSSLAQTISTLYDKFSGYLPVTNGNITGAAPSLGFNENDQTGPMGLWRWIATGGRFVLQRNTHPARDFSQTDAPISIDALGNIVFLNAPSATSPDLNDNNQKLATTSWVKSQAKPSYSWSEIGDRPTNISQLNNDAGYLTRNSGVSSVNGMRGDVSIDTSSNALGVGQTWKSVSRSAYVTYTNSNSRPILIIIKIYRDQYSALPYVYVSNTLVFGGYAAPIETSCLSVVVPSGATYLTTGAAWVVSELS